MSDPNFDQLSQHYQQATEAWVAAIRAEEALVTPDHSMIAMEDWDAADFAVKDAESAAKKARDAYKDALRQKNYGF